MSETGEAPTGGGRSDGTGRRRRRRGGEAVVVVAAVVVDSHPTNYRARAARRPISIRPIDSRVVGVMKKSGPLIANSANYAVA